MDLTVRTQALSALTPVRLRYLYNSEEELNYVPNVYSGNFRYYQYTILDSYKDAVLSKHNCLVLTDIKNLQTVFKQSSTEVNIGTIAGCTFLKTKNGKTVKSLNNQLYVGGTGKDLFLNIVPISNNEAYLKASATQFLQIDSSYPYTVRLVEETIAEEEEFRRKFIIDYADKQISIKVKTPEGFRFLSYGVDNVLRAVGVELNETLVNPYRFITDLISTDTIKYGFVPRTDEVKYYNSLTIFENRDNVFLRQARNRPSSTVLSFPTHKIDKNGDVVINIALTKTNFSSSGTYSIEQ